MEKTSQRVRPLKQKYRQASTYVNTEAMQAKPHMSSLKHILHPSNKKNLSI